MWKPRSPAAWCTTREISRRYVLICAPHTRPFSPAGHCVRSVRPCLNAWAEQIWWRSIWSLTHTKVKTKVFAEPRAVLVAKSRGVTCASNDGCDDVSETTSLIRSESMHSISELNAGRAVPRASRMALDTTILRSTCLSWSTSPRPLPATMAKYCSR